MAMALQYGPASEDFGDEDGFFEAHTTGATTGPDRTSTGGERERWRRRAWRRVRKQPPAATARSPFTLW